MSNYKLLDVWHRKHSDEPGYTYYDKKNQSYSRLDYVLISENTCYEVHDISICQPIKNQGIIDYNSLKVSFNINVNKRQLGYWKIKNSVLSDEQYRNGVNRIIENTCIEYEKLKSHQLIWEILKVHIKEYTIEYCINKRKQYQININDVQKESNKFNEQIMRLDIKNLLTKVEKQILCDSKARK